MKPILLLVSCFAIGNASAANLAYYTFGTDLSYTTKDANVTATAFTGATGRSTGSYAYRFTTSPGPYQMQFTLTASSGYLLDLSTISFSYDFLQSSGTVVNYNSAFEIYYSTDGFANSTLIQTFSDTSGTAITMGGPAFNTSGALNLSALPDLSSIGFRFVFSNDSSPALNTNTYRYSIDEVTVVGNAIAVPEPASSALLLAGLGLPGFLRRRS